ncbi:Ribosomal protein L11 methyltransferase [hydrothermal vent metagenome]|uniref:Ribosomal protein L11 methyltransferase n=1 Tax=hydrothermal vent metagenome TaxID=652676 RepID=A0A3B1DKB1_9ZZZZ
MSIKNPKTFELSIKFKSGDSGQVAVVQGMLAKEGVDQETIVELEKDNHAFLSIYFQIESEAKKLYRKIEGLCLKRVSIKLISLSAKDWQDIWKKDFKPFVLTKRFKVVPTWLKETTRKNKYELIYIDTSMAFGTGLHETTRFMAQLIEQRFKDVRSFLDIGTGTGILAMIALRCGARELRAMDISEDAVAVAKQNFRENNCVIKDVFAADIQKYRGRKQYDFVAANLITADLIQFGLKIIRFVKPGKYLAVSGISLENLRMFQKNFNQYPLRCLKVKKGKKWAAVLYKKL